MRRPGPFQLGFETPVHQPMHRLIGHLFAPLSGQPLLDRALAAEALGFAQPRLQRRKSGCRYRALFRGRTTRRHP
jgi:hypothetical protein